MSVAIDSNKQSTKVYINNVLCTSKVVDIIDMVLPYIFSYLSVVIYEDELHVLGGNSTTNTYHIKWDGTQWVTVSTLPIGNDGCAVVYDGEIHLFSDTSHYGWDGTQWNTYTLPNVNMKNGHCVVNGNLHILGGTNNPTMHYEWNGSEWVSASTLPINFVDGSVVVYDDKINILSGTNHYEWDGTSWTSVSTLPASFKYGDAFSSDKIYMIGCGESNDQSYLWDGQEWTEGEELNIPLVNGKVASLNNSIYCIECVHFFTSFSYIIFYDYNN